MKIAFSTLGCPDWSWGETVAAAKDLGYDGLELRVVEGEIYLPNALIFAPGKLEETKSMLVKRGLALSCLSSAANLNLADRHPESFHEGLSYIDLAARLGVPYVRVLGDKDPHPHSEVDDDLVSRGLKTMGEKGAAAGVTVLIETNGAYADTKRLRQVVAAAGGKGLGVLWDVHHPYRFARESFAETWANIGEFVRYLHIKDSVLEEGRVVYRFLGDGDLPLRELPGILTGAGFDGWLTLEWVKLWQPDLEEPGVVFPHFVQACKDLFGQAAKLGG